MQLSLKNEHDKYEIGEKIREKRTALGLSQDELADMVGTDGNSVSRHENGSREMKISQFCQYAEALSASAAELLPERLSKKPEGKYAELVSTAADLSEGDLEILLLMAKRMKAQAS